MRFFPPIVTGPIIIAIGLSLSSSAVNNCAHQLAGSPGRHPGRHRLQHLGQGHDKDNPHPPGRHRLLPRRRGERPGGLHRRARGGLDRPARRPGARRSSASSAAGTWTRLMLAHRGRHHHPHLALPRWSSTSAICAPSAPPAAATTSRSPGLHRTLLGDGLATSLAALFGAPANTTYGENTGVLALSKVYDPRVIRIAAVLAIIFSFCPKFARGSPRHAHRRHRRRQPRALRHDKRRRRAQRCREQGGFHQEPQCHHRRPHPGAGHRHHLLRHRAR